MPTDIRLLLPTLVLGIAGAACDPIEEFQAQPFVMASADAEAERAIPIAQSTKAMESVLRRLTKDGVRHQAWVA